jgi:HEAT repeat protein
MAVYRSSRGVPLPTFPQLLLLVVVGGAIYLLWAANSQQRLQSQVQEAAVTGPIEDLQAVETLIDLGSEAVPELVSQAASDDLRKRRMALMGLGRLKQDAAGALDTVRSRLSDENSDIRSQALWAFTQICTDPEDLWPTIAQMLADPSNDIRETAVGLLDGATTHHIAIFADKFPLRFRVPRLTPEEDRQRIRAVFPLAQSERSDLRGLAIRILTAAAKRNDRDVTEVLLGLVNDRDPAVRVAAISAVAQRGAARVEDVREWLRDDDSRVVDSGLFSVPWLGSEGEQVVPELLALVDKLPDNRLTALMTALRPYKSSAKPALPGLVRRVAGLELNYYVLSGQRRSPIYSNFNTMQALVNLEPERAEIVPLLTRALEKNHPDYSQQAAAILVQLDPEVAAHLVERLIKTIEADPIGDREAIAVNSALGAIHGLGPIARDAVPVLIHLIEQENDPQFFTAHYSTEALGGIGPDAAPALPRLVSVLNRPKTGDNPWKGLGVVVTCLGKIGPAARSAVPSLLDILEQPRPPEPKRDRFGRATSAAKDSPPYRQAVIALGKIGDDSEQVIAALQEELANAEPHYCQLEALHSLFRLCQKADHSGTVLPDLISALGDSSPGARFVVASLGQIQGDRTPAIPDLIKLLDDEDPLIVARAALSLGQIGPAAVSAAPRLRGLMGHVSHRGFNALGSRFSFLRDVLDIEPAEFKLDRLSIAEAARRALESIDPHGTAFPTDSAN